MAVVPTGAYGAAMANVKAMLVASDAFQEFCGIDPEDEDAADDAAECVYYQGVDDPGDNRPFAVIESKTGSWEKTSGGGSNAYRGSGELSVVFELDGDEDLTASENEITMMNHVDSVLSDLRNAAAVGTNLDIVGITADGVVRSDHRTGYYLQEMVSIRW